MNKFLPHLLLPALAWTALAACTSAQTTPTPFHVPLNQRQLFLDDHGIDHLDKLQRTLHQPAKQGTVIAPDQAWESTLQTRSAPIWDPAVERFKLWMITSTTLPGVAEMTYAESADGLRWTKPALRQKALQGSLENNIVTLDPAREWGANAIENVVYDPHDPDPARRFKGFANVYDREPMTSPDGLHWTLLDVPPLPSQDESNLCYDPVTRTFIATLKTNGPFGRSHALWTSKDFANWTDTGIVFHADEEDQVRGRQHIADRLADPTLHHPDGMDPADSNVDVYNLGIARYEGLYLGFPALYHGSNESGFHLIQLACSRDLKTWERLGNRATFIGPSPANDSTYDWTQLLPPSRPVLHGEELRFYYTGIRYRNPPEDASKIGAICLATLRRDGFVSLDGGEEAGTVLTEPFKKPAGALHVNVDARGGALVVEMLDDMGRLLARSMPVTGDQTDRNVSWVQENGPADAATTIRLRFSVQNASLYAYWFSGE